MKLQFRFNIQAVESLIMVSGSECYEQEWLKETGVSPIPGVPTRDGGHSLSFSFIKVKHDRTR